MREPKEETIKLSKDVNEKLDKKGEILVGKKCFVSELVDVPEHDYLVSNFNYCDDDAQKIIKTAESLNKEIKKGKLIGTVILIEEDIVTLDLDKKYDFTISLNEFIDKNTYISIEKDKLIPFKQDKKENDKIVGFLSKSNNNSIVNITGSLRNLHSSVVYNEKDIRDFLESIKNRRKKVSSDKLLIESKKKELEKIINCEKEFENYVKKIYKNKLVDKIEYYNDSVFEARQEGLVVTTKKLKYNGEIKIPLGIYKIFLNNSSIKAVNVSRNFKNGQYHHPCVTENGSFCFGNELGDSIKTMLSSQDFASAIHITINFLQEPNYQNPYIPANVFNLAQDIKLEEDVTNNKWFDYNFWQSLSFDLEKFQADYSNLTR